jgi:superoxide dismutase, Cu-Zn family
MLLSGQKMGSSLMGGVCLLLGCREDHGATRKEVLTGLNPAGVQVPTSTEVLRARALVAGPPGSGIKGEVTFVQLKVNWPVPGVQIEARINGPTGRLTPGPHGMHIHERGQGGCAPPYTGAGGHFDPGPAANPDPDVNHPFHMGDLPNLVVDKGGTGVLEATTSRVTLSPGPLSVFDDDGSSIIVHEKADQGATGPARSGVSGGPRIACGMIKMEGDEE